MIAIKKIPDPGEKILRQAISAKEDKFFREEEFLYYSRNLVEKLASNHDAVLYLAKEKEEIAGYGIFSYLKWDSEIFGFKVGRIEDIFFNPQYADKKRFINKILLDCRKERYRHICARIGLRDFEILKTAEQAGFCVADIQITLSTGTSLQDMPSFASNGLKVRQAKLNDLSSLNYILKDGFTDTRFAADRNFPGHKVEKLYSQWLKNSLLNSQKYVFVIKDTLQKKPVGFCICAIDNRSKGIFSLRLAAIELVAIAKDYRNKGVAVILLSFVLSWLKNKADKAEIRTQASNIPALRAFLKAGFKEISQGTILPAGISLHYWF